MLYKLSKLKSRSVVAPLISAAAIASFCSYPATASTSLTKVSKPCVLSDKAKGHSKPKDSCTVVIEADAGAVLVPSTLTTISSDGVGALRESRPKFEYNTDSTEWIYQIAPTRITLQFSCTNTRGMGRNCYYANVVHVQQRAVRDFQKAKTK